MPEQWEKDRKLFIESFPGWKCFQTFDDISERKSRKLIYQASTNGDQYAIDNEIDFTKSQIPAKIIQDLEARNQYQACCSLTINETDGKGRTRKNMVCVRSLFADFDGSPIPKTWDIEPSMVVNTSPGKYHVYFFTVIDDDSYNVPMVSFPTLQESIASKYKTDESMKDITKALRIPGFYHTKKEPYMVNIVSYSGKRYQFGELVEVFPPLPREQFSAPKYQKEFKQDPNSEYKGSYGCGEGGRNHHIVKRIGGMKKRGLPWGEIEQEAFKEAGSCSPPLPAHEVKAILKSMSRY